MSILSTIKAFLSPAGAAPAPIVVSLPTPSVNPSAQHSITQYESTKDLVQTIPVTIQITNYVFNTIYTVQLPNLSVGDILQITSQCELTGDYTFNTMIAGYLQIRHSGGSFRVSEASGCDIVNGIEHCTWNMHKQYLVPKELTNVSLDLVMYTASTAAKLGDFLTVNQGYGHLDCVLIR